MSRALPKTPEELACRVAETVKKKPWIKGNYKGSLTRDTYRSNYYKADPEDTAKGEYGFCAVGYITDTIDEAFKNARSFESMTLRETLRGELLKLVARQIRPNSSFGFERIITSYNDKYAQKKAQILKLFEAVCAPEVK